MTVQEEGMRPTDDSQFYPYYGPNYRDEPKRFWSRWPWIAAVVLALVGAGTGVAALVGVPKAVVGPQGQPGAQGSIGPQGPVGATGATGATGARGPAGPRGAVSSTSVVTAAPVLSAINPPVGSVVSATVGCPSGKFLLGGGGRVSATGAGNNYNAVVHSSYPAASNAWTVDAVVTAPLGPGSAMELVPYALCGA
jgi:hypothetical protein